MFLVAMPGAPSSFLLLVVRPGAPSSILAPSCFLIAMTSNLLAMASTLGFLFSPESLPHRCRSGILEPEGGSKHKDPNTTKEQTEGQQVMSLPLNTVQKETGTWSTLTGISLSLKSLEEEWKPKTETCQFKAYSPPYCTSYSNIGK